MKSILRKMIYRLFGIDICHTPKPIRYTGVWKVEIPEDQPENYPEYLHNLLYNKAK